MNSVRSSMTADLARGRAVSALVFLGFGETWLLLGLGGLAGSHGLAQIIVVAMGVLVLVAAVDLLRRAKVMPAGVLDTVQRERARRMFRAVNIIQWVSVAVAIAILNILHLAEYAVTAIAIIVGLHMFPLAGTFRNRQHYLTGALLVAWPLVCLVTLPRTQVSAVTAVGAGAVLLLSAVVTLLRATGARRMHDGGPVAAVERP
jgi:hypothetical protein